MPSIQPCLFEFRLTIVRVDVTANVLTFDDILVSSMMAHTSSFSTIRVSGGDSSFPYSFVYSISIEYPFLSFLSCFDCQRVHSIPFYSHFFEIPFYSHFFSGTTFTPPSEYQKPNL